MQHLCVWAKQTTGIRMWNNERYWKNKFIRPVVNIQEQGPCQTFGAFASAKWYSHKTASGAYAWPFRWSLYLLDLTWPIKSVTRTRKEFPAHCKPPFCLMLSCPSYPLTAWLQHNCTVAGYCTLSIIEGKINKWALPNKSGRNGQHWLIHCWFKSWFSSL